MAHGRPHSLTLAATLLAGLMLASVCAAEERAIFSPIIHVDPDKGLLVVSVDGAVIAVEGTQEAKPHMGKLPIGGMIDIVIELRQTERPILKTWKVAAGESACKLFDGKSCK
jgi:MFS superfamily sulfate permease-like transporter